MHDRFVGRRILVTGAARGIGATIAARFLAEGARVALVDRDETGLAAATAELGGDAVVPVGVDLADADATRVAVARAVEELGGLDVCVNNAGLFAKAPLLSIDVDDWDALFAVNVRAALVVIQAATPALVASDAGRIVNIASMAAKVGTPGEAHYAASKAALVALTRIAALELGADGITVNAVCPGYVLTEMGADTRTPEQVAAWSSQSPLGRLATPDDVADVVLFLASPAGSYLTGQAVNVTGGMVMH